MARPTRDTSPIGWYVGSYLLRFVEIGAAGNDDLDGEFFVCENTIIVQSDSLEEAYKKVEAEAMLYTDPYKSGPDSVVVRWIFEGVRDLVPIYEPLEDGAEIMWTEHEAIKLSRLRRMVISVDELTDAKDID